MTKIELIDRIMAVTRVDEAREPNRQAIRATIMECVEGYAGTLLQRVRMDLETALQANVMNLATHMRAEGREGE